MSDALTDGDSSPLVDTPQNEAQAEVSMRPVPLDERRDAHHEEEPSTVVVPPVESIASNEGRTGGQYSDVAIQAEAISSKESADVNIDDPETEPVIPALKKRRPRSKRQRIIIWSVVAVLLLSIIIPATYAVNYGISAYNTYNMVRNSAYSGMQHLLNV